MARSIGLLGLSFLPNAVNWEAVRRGGATHRRGIVYAAHHIIHRVAPIWRGGAAESDNPRRLLSLMPDIACPRYRGRTPGAAAIS